MLRRWYNARAILSGWGSPGEGIPLVEGWVGRKSPGNTGTTASWTENDSAPSAGGYLESGGIGLPDMLVGVSVNSFTAFSPVL
jgi:hypothetical protein